jgi:hypothetical protein
VLDSRHLARCVDAPASGVALKIETPEQRTQRLLGRRDALQRQGMKAFLQVIAQEEGLSVSMVKKILSRKKQPQDSLTGWAAGLVSGQGVSSNKKRKP